MLNTQQRKWLKDAINCDIDTVIKQLGQRIGKDDKKAAADVVEINKLLPNADKLIDRLGNDQIGLLKAAVQHGVKDTTRFMQLACDYLGVKMDAAIARERRDGLVASEQGIEQGLAHGGLEVTGAVFNFSVKGAGDIQSGVAHIRFESGGNVPAFERAATIRGGSCHLKALPISAVGTVHIRLELAALRGETFEPMGHTLWNLNKSAAGKTDLIFDVQVGVTEEQISLAKTATKGGAHKNHQGSSSQDENTSSTTGSASATVSDDLTIAGEAEENLGVEKSKGSVSNQTSVSGTASVSHTGGSRHQTNQDNSQDDEKNWTGGTNKSRTGTVRRINDSLVITMQE